VSKKENNYAGGTILPASIKEKETHWPEVPCVSPTNRVVNGSHLCSKLMSFLFWVSQQQSKHLVSKQKGRSVLASVSWPAAVSVKIHDRKRYQDCCYKGLRVDAWAALSKDSGTSCAQESSQLNLLWWWSQPQSTQPLNLLLLTLPKTLTNAGTTTQTLLDRLLRFCLPRARGNYSDMLPEHIQLHWEGSSAVLLDQYQVQKLAITTTGYASRNYGKFPIVNRPN
jgi:hypothetical protein